MSRGPTNMSVLAQYPRNIKSVLITSHSRFQEMSHLRLCCVVDDGGGDDDDDDHDDDDDGGGGGGDNTDDDGGSDDHDVHVCVAGITSSLPHCLFGSHKVMDEISASHCSRSERTKVRKLWRASAPWNSV